MSDQRSVRLTINGEVLQAQLSPGITLLDYLRNTLHLTGTKNGCTQGHTGTCTVVVNGQPTPSCSTLVSDLNGCSIETIEGLARNGNLHPLQAAFIQEGAIQCGYCTPGMIMASKGLLDNNPNPTETEIRNALKDHLCRCTGYSAIIRAVLNASHHIQAGIQSVDESTIDYLPDGRSPLGNDAVDQTSIEYVTGSAKYGEDIVLEGMLIGKLKWSDYPSARILSIDTSEAEKIPGVSVILTAKDVHGTNRVGMLRRDQPAIAADQVRSMGEVVAAVFANDEKIAQHALECIQAQYEPLPGVFSMEAAALQGAWEAHEGGNLCHSSHLERGNTQEAFSHAAVIVENTFTTPAVDHGFLETESGVAWPDHAGGVVIEIGTQAPFDDRTQLSEALGLPEKSIRIKQIPMGGAFGGKEDLVLQTFLALGALRTGKPVKIVLTRQESLKAHPKRHPAIMVYKTAASADGHLLAVEADITVDTGAYASLGPDIIENMLSFGAGPYFVPNLKMHARAYYTNNITSGAMRGFGVPQVAFAMEAQVDAMSRALGIDPFEFRRINALGVGSVLATDHILEASVGIRQTLDACETALHKDKIPASTKKVGVGVACSLKNIGFGHGFPESVGAVAELKEDGMVNIIMGVADYGQGSRTALTQIAAQTLGVPYQKVNMQYVDTAVSPPSGATTASRQTYLSGNAIISACQQLKAEIFHLAEDELHFPAAEMDIRNGQLIHSPTGQTYDLSLLNAHLRAEAQYQSPQTDAFTESPSKYGQPGFKSRRTHFTYSYGTHVAIVEVDEESGTVRVLKVIAAHDVGYAINPKIIRGQIEGGVMMGLGYGLSEEYVMLNGIPQTQSLKECGFPTILDMPEIQAIIVDDPDPNGPFGAKGLGEISILPTAAAIVNAIYDATGVRITSLPASPQNVARAIHEHNNASL